MPAKRAAPRKPRPPRYDPATLRLLLDAFLTSLPVRIEREFRFHPIRRWRFDYAAPDLKLAIELDGAIWTQGRHTRGSGYLGDLEKFNTAALMGWRVLRITYDMIADGSALALIERALGLGSPIEIEALHERGTYPDDTRQPARRAHAKAAAATPAQPGPAQPGRPRRPRTRGDQTRQGGATGATHAG